MLADKTRLYLQYFNYHQLYALYIALCQAISPFKRNNLLVTTYIRGLVANTSAATGNYPDQGTKIHKEFS